MHDDDQTPGEEKSFIHECFIILGNFIIGQFMIAALEALIAVVTFKLMGIDHALWLGLFVGLMGFVPYVGPVIGFLPALVFAWLTHHQWGYLLGVMLLWLVLQLLEPLVFQPLILGNRLKIHPLLVIASFCLWGLLLGPVGIILAIPLTAVLQVAIRRWRKNA